MEHSELTDILVEEYVESHPVYNLDDPSDHSYVQSRVISGPFDGAIVCMSRDEFNKIIDRGVMVFENQETRNFHFYMYNEIDNTLMFYMTEGAA